LLLRGRRLQYLGSKVILIYHQVVVPGWGDAFQAPVSPLQDSMRAHFKGMTLAAHPGKRLVQIAVPLP